MDEARKLCKDRSKWRFVVSVYPNGKMASVCVYTISRIRIEKATIILPLHTETKSSFYRSSTKALLNDAHPHSSESCIKIVTAVSEFVLN